MNKNKFVEYAREYLYKVSLSKEMGALDQQRTTMIVNAMILSLDTIREEATPSTDDAIHEVLLKAIDDANTRIVQEVGSTGEESRKIAIENLRKKIEANPFRLGFFIERETLEQRHEMEQKLGLNNTLGINNRDGAK